MSVMKTSSRVRLSLLIAGTTLALSAGALAAPVSLTSAGLTVFRTCTLTANPATTPTEFDANVEQDNPATNYATLASLSVTSHSGSANRRSYVRFDLTKCTPTVPATATVTSATLKAYDSNLPPTCRTHDVFRVDASWAESTITWNNQPFGTTVDSPASTQRTDSASVGQSVCQYSALGYVSWKVTSDVQNILNLTNANYGWMIRDDAEDSSVTQASTYEPRETANVFRAPMLVVTYKLS
jgi:hypothetical protein